MNILSTAPSTATSDYARQTRARAALEQAAESRKSAVSEDAAKVRSAPRFAAAESRKSQAKAKLQQVREWLKIVQKLYAQNPTGMAKALTQVFKDLKAAVAAYKDAGGQEMGGAGAAVAALPPSRPAEDADAASGEDGEAPGADTKSDESAARSPVPEGVSLYDAVVGEVRKQVGEDGLAFLKEVRGMVEDIRKLLDTARGQAAIRRRDTQTDKTFEAADKALKDLNETMDTMDQQIRRDAPSAGMTLSVAA
ncbi:MAG: hypothetical protein Q8L66_12290 [Caulobacter sp.]|nr:hypothetical protein [Caulobacter sp.]